MARVGKPFLDGLILRFPFVRHLSKGKGWGVVASKGNGCLELIPSTKKGVGKRAGVMIFG